MSGFDWYLVLICIFEGAILLLLPHYSPRRYFFAVTVPPEFRGSDEARRSLRRYHAWVVLGVIVSAALALAGWPPFLPFVIGFGAYLRERSVVKRFASTTPPVREASLVPGGDELPSWMPVAVLPFFGPFAAATYLRAHWEEIPARFAVHFSANGTPDRWVSKTPGNVYGMLLFSTAVMLMILLLSVAAFYGSRRGPQRIAILKMLVSVNFVMSLVFSGMGLTPLVHFPVWAFVVPIPIFVVILVAWSFRAARNMPGEDTPDEFWHFGEFYYNPNDAALFVQKRIGFGYTFNFGNRLSWAFLGAMAAVFGALVLLVPK
jgi:hypothetical protein